MKAHKLRLKLSHKEIGYLYRSPKKREKLSLKLMIQCIVAQLSMVALF